MTAKEKTIDYTLTISENGSFNPNVLENTGIENEEYALILRNCKTAEHTTGRLLLRMKRVTYEMFHRLSAGWQTTTRRVRRTWSILRMRQKFSILG